MLNVTDPLNISYLNAYTDPKAKKNSTDDSEIKNISKSNGTAKISTGAIAGIVVGAVVGVIKHSFFFNTTYQCELIK